MKRILGIVLIAFMIASCEKEENNDYTITAVVIDLDTQTPVAGAKVYSSVLYLPANPTPLVDSGLTDASGRISFTYQKDDFPRNIHATKNGYDYPVYAPIYRSPQTNQDRIDTFFLAKTSWLDVHLHRANTYLTGDILQVWVEGYRRNRFIFYGGTMVKTIINQQPPRNALAADTSLHTPSVYFAAPYQKAYINWQVNRNGSAIANGVDSTDMVQYGTKSFTLNY